MMIFRPLFYTPQHLSFFFWQASIPVFTICLLLTFVMFKLSSWSVINVFSLCGESTIKHVAWFTFGPWQLLLCSLIQPPLFLQSLECNPFQERTEPFIPAHHWSTTLVKLYPLTLRLSQSLIVCFHKLLESNLRLEKRERKRFVPHCVDLTVNGWKCKARAVKTRRDKGGLLEQLLKQLSGEVIHHLRSVWWRRRTRVQGIKLNHCRNQSFPQQCKGLQVWPADEEDKICFIHSWCN